MALSPHHRRLIWFSFALAVLAATGVWAYGVTRHTIDEQRNLVPVSTLWGMHACFVAAVAGLGGMAASVRRLLRRRQWLTSLALVFAGYLACGLAPRTSRIFFDEHIYMQIGQTIALTGRAEAANYARVEYGKFEMYNSWVNKQPNGLPYLLSWLYRIFGVSDNVSYSLNRILVGVTAAALYLALSIVEWTLPAGAALASGLLFIFTPLVLWWGRTVAAEPGAACTAALAFLAACVHTRFREKETAQGLPASALFLAGTTAFAAYFRPESVLVFPLVAAVLWSSEDRFIEDLAAWGALALALALAAPTLLHLWSMHTEDWGAKNGDRFGWDFIGKNLASNAGYFVDSEWFPVAGTVLGLAGVLWLLGRNRGAGVALGVWFALSWGIFVVFYAGGYYYGASSRYAVVSCAPVAIFMGIGLTALLRRLWCVPVTACGLAAAGMVNWVAGMHYVPTLSREAVEAEADADFIARAARTLPEGSLVLSPDPCMWLLQGINSSQYFTSDEMVHHDMRELASQYPGGVYAHWSFWHNAEPAIAAETAKLLVETKAREVMRTQCQTFKLALFRIDTPTAMERFGGKPPVSGRPDTDLDHELQQAQAAASAAPPPPP